MLNLLAPLFIGLLCSTSIAFEQEQHRYNFVIEKMSAPLRGIDELEDFDILDQLPLQLEPLPVESMGRTWLKKYALTSYGSRMFSTLVDDFNLSVERGYLTQDGALTKAGKQALKNHFWKGPFIIASSDTQPTGSPRSVQIPADYNPRFFPVGGEAVDPLALIHHEFGHTHFSSIRTLGREHLAIERDVVRLFENPVRLLNKFSLRKIYFDESNTLSIISGNIYPGPAMIFFNNKTEKANPYFYTRVHNEIKIVRGADGKGVINKSVMLKPLLKLQENP